MRWNGMLKMEGQEINIVKAGQVVGLPFLFHAVVSLTKFCFIEDVADYTGKKREAAWRRQ